MAIVVHHNNNNALLQSAMALAGAWAEGDITRNIAQEEINRQAGEHRQETVRGLFDTATDTINLIGDRKREDKLLADKRNREDAQIKDAQSFEETRDANTEQARRSLAKYRFGLAIDEARAKEQYKADLEMQEANNAEHNKNRVVDEVGMKKIANRFNSEMEAIHRQRDMLGEDGVRAAQEVALRARNKTPIPMRSMTSEEKAIAAGRPVPGSSRIKWVTPEGGGAAREMVEETNEKGETKYRELDETALAKFVRETYSGIISNEQHDADGNIIPVDFDAAMDFAKKAGAALYPGDPSAASAAPATKQVPKQVSPEIMTQAKKFLSQLDGPPSGWSDMEFAKAVEAAELIFRQVIAAGDKTLARKLQKILEENAKRRSASSN